MVRPPRALRFDGNTAGSEVLAVAWPATYQVADSILKPPIVSRRVVERQKRFKRSGQRRAVRSHIKIECYHAVPAWQVFGAYEGTGVKIMRSEPDAMPV